MYLHKNSRSTDYNNKFIIFIILHFKQSDKCIGKYMGKYIFQYLIHNNMYMVYTSLVSLVLCYVVDINY